MSWFRISQELIDIFVNNDGFTDRDGDGWISKSTWPFKVINDDKSMTISEKFPEELVPGDIVWYPDGKIGTIYLKDGKMCLKRDRNLT